LCHLYSYVFFSIMFFFSSRRRHTRSKRDWSSDVCSSDLDSVFLDVTIFVDRTITLDEAHDICDKVERSLAAEGVYSSYVHPEPRSEERRVGKECRSQL